MILKKNLNIFIISSFISIIGIAYNYRNTLTDTHTPKEEEDSSSSSDDESWYSSDDSGEYHDSSPGVVNNPDVVDVSRDIYEDTTPSYI